MEGARCGSAQSHMSTKMVCKACQMDTQVTNRAGKEDPSITYAVRGLGTVVRR